MQKAEYPLPEGSSLMELLVFVALLLPTFIVLAAAVVSIAHPEPSVAVPRAAQTTAGCEACRGHQPYDTREDDR